MSETEKPRRRRVLEPPVVLDTDHDSADAFQRARLHIADMLESGVSLMFLKRATNLSDRRFYSFASGKWKAHDFLPSLIDTVLSIDKNHAVEESFKQSKGRMNIGSVRRRRYELAQEIRQKVASEIAPPDRRVIIRRNTKVPEQPDREIGRQKVLASVTLALPPPREPKEEGILWLSPEGAPAPTTEPEPPEPEVSAPEPTPAFREPRPLPSLSTSDVRGVFGIGMDERATFRSTTDAELAHKTDVSIEVVCSYRQEHGLPAARCTRCKDRLIAAHRTQFCDPCAFVLHEDLLRSLERGEPPPQQEQESTDEEESDETMGFEGSRPPVVGAPARTSPFAVSEIRIRPSLAKCRMCAGHLGTRRSVCLPCAYEKFVEESLALAQAGAELK